MATQPKSIEEMQMLVQVTGFLGGICAKLEDAISEGLNKLQERVSDQHEENTKLQNKNLELKNDLSAANVLNTDGQHKITELQNKNLELKNNLSAALSKTALDQVSQAQPGQSGAASSSKMAVSSVSGAQTDQGKAASSSKMAVSLVPQAQTDQGKAASSSKMAVNLVPQAQTYTSNVGSSLKRTGNHEHQGGRAKKQAVVKSANADNALGNDHAEVGLLYVPKVHNPVATKVHNQVAKKVHNPVAKKKEDPTWIGMVEEHGAAFRTFCERHMPKDDGSVILVETLLSLHYAIHRLFAPLIAATVLPKCDKKTIKALANPYTRARENLSVAYFMENKTTITLQHAAVCISEAIYGDRGNTKEIMLILQNAWTIIATAYAKRVEDRNKGEKRVVHFFKVIFALSQKHRPLAVVAKVFSELRVPELVFPAKIDEKDMKDTLEKSQNRKVVKWLHFNHTYEDIRVHLITEICSVPKEQAGWFKGCFKLIGKRKWKKSTPIKEEESDDDNDDDDDDEDDL
jgi:hypothetical protein